MMTTAGGPGEGIAAAFLATFVFSSLLAVFSTYHVRRTAHRLGLFDRPDGKRRLHLTPIPRIGGIAVYLTVVFVLMVALFTIPGALLFDHQRVFFSVILGATAIFGLGLLDDVAGLTVGQKLLVEVVVAVSMYASGVRIESVGPPGAELVFAPWLSLLITTLWLVGITNAFNLIDGSDGVAGGAALFAAASVAVVALISGHTLGAIAGLAIAGATLGFLFFNFPPASVFLGDCGSLFLGFTLAALGILTTQAATSTVAIAIPVVACGLPILDLLLAIARRFLRGDGIFNPDRGHIHHRLRDLGHTPKKIALVLYASCAGFALLSLLLMHPRGALTATVFAAAGAAVVIGVQRLNIPELLEVRRILHRGMLQRVVIAYNVRLREAVVRLKQATSPGDIVNAISYALGSGEFARAELALPPGVARWFQGTGLVARRGTSWVWQWESSTSCLSTTTWEMHLPLRLAAGQGAAQLSIWVTGDAGHLLTDLSLLAVEVGPALEGALMRLGAVGPHFATGTERSALAAPNKASA